MRLSSIGLPYSLFEPAAIYLYFSQAPRLIKHCTYLWVQDCENVAFQNIWIPFLKSPPNSFKPHENAPAETPTLKWKTPSEGTYFLTGITSNQITEAPVNYPIESSLCELRWAIPLDSLLQRFSKTCQNRSHRTSQRDPQPSASSVSSCPQESEGKSRTGEYASIFIENSSWCIDTEVTCDFYSKQDTPASSSEGTEVIGLWKCRICHGEMIQPTATMCGHLFCKRSDVSLWWSHETNT